MDYNYSNGIKKFKCNQCNQLVEILIFKSNHKRVGYLCKNCWKTFNKRIKEIYHL